MEKQSKGIYLDLLSEPNSQSQGICFLLEGTLIDFGLNTGSKVSVCRYTLHGFSVFLVLTTLLII